MELLLIVNYEYLIYLLIVSGVILTIKTRKLTIAGALLAGVIGVLVFAGGGYASFMMLCIFFTTGTLATSWKKNVKETLEGPAHDDTRRTAGQVFSNGGVAAICAGLALLLPQYHYLFKLMLAGSLAAATADTLSSELGMVLGKRFYNILTLKKDKAGLDGVISLEGTLAGVSGSGLIALVYCLKNGFNIAAVWIIIAGTIGNLTDSYLGATLERKGVLNNNMVNLSNTLVGAIACVIVVLFY